MVLAALSTLILGISPVATVKAFVAAINAGDFVSARMQLLAPGNSNDAESLKVIGFKLELQRCELKSRDANSAIVTCRARKSTSREFRTDPVTGDNEEVQLTKVGEQWKICLLDPNLYVNRPLHVNQLVFLLGRYGDSGLRVIAQNVECSKTVRRGKQLATCMLLYVADNDDVLPKAANWKKAILPYVRSGDPFTVPPDKAGTVSWSYNGKLAGKSWALIENPEAVVFFYLGKGGQPDYRFGNRTVVVFCDGHVKAMTKAEVAKVKWK
ncbi:MAG: hypothetical protein JST35_07245 [Armatimonadetes bacterium]|nr:hypothetical protein [Armatimonadota bacterium]